MSLARDGMAHPQFLTLSEDLSTTLSSLEM